MLRGGRRGSWSELKRLSCWAFAPAGAEVCGCNAALGSARKYATDALTHQLSGMTLINKGFKQGPGGRSSVSGITATVFGSNGFLARYVINALATAGSQVVVPYRCDDLDCQHLRAMGDLGQIIQFKDFNARNDDQIREAIHRSNLVINLIGIDKETMNWSFEETHIDVAQRIAKAVSESDLVERFWHVSCLGAKQDAKSRRLRTKWEGEQAVRRMMPDATIFKVAQMVGVEDRLFNNYAQMAKRFPIIPLIDGGHNRLQPVYVRDVSEGMMATLRDRESVGKDYYLAGPATMTTKELVQLTFETIRERYHSVYLPAPLARALGAPREMLKNRLPIPVNYFFTQDYADECLEDHVVPTDRPVLTFQDLAIEPLPINKGNPIEHVRYYRVGGYDLGTTGENQATGGAGFGG